MLTPNFQYHKAVTRDQYMLTPSILSHNSRNVWPIQDQYTLKLGRRDFNASTNLPARGPTLQTSSLVVQPYGPPRP